MSFKLKFCILVVLTFFISIKTLAAVGPESIHELEEKVYYDVTPEKPNIGDNISITAEMYGTEVKDANFQWKVNGAILKDSIGGNTFNFTLTTKSRVDLKITTGAGVIIDKFFEFNPKKIMLIWESRTYTPPFYKGKSLFSPEASLVLSAFNLDQANPLTNTYNDYTWTVDDNVKGSDSGVGYSTYSYEGDILKSQPIFGVSVSGITTYKDRQANQDNSYDNETVITVPIFPSQIITYEKSPLLGVLFNKTVGTTYKLNKSETILVSYPFYYGLTSSLSGIYSWYINDVKINTNLNQLSFKKTKDNAQSLLTLEIKNVNSILQTRSVSYTVDTTK